MEQSPFPIRGVIEGFYGAFYTWPERNDLIAFMGQHGYNLYIYGPKNDRQHRVRWWEPYPDSIGEEFRQTVTLAQSHGVAFCYAIAPLNYDPAQDWERLTRKLRTLYDYGVRAWSIFMDDILCSLHGWLNCRVCSTSADVHVDICNRLYAWLQGLDPQCTLSMCPDQYAGRTPFSGYLHDLGARLDPAINVFYTGPDVCSTTITADDAHDFAHALQRLPVIWDNYPVNDLGMRPELHIGPIQGRAADLGEAVHGIVVNPMLQPEASKIPLLTFADYLRDPQGYDAWRAWEGALRAIGGDACYAALACFAENSLQSCLRPNEPSKLAKLVDAALLAVQGRQPPAQSEALAALATYLDTLDEACYVLKHWMPNLRLRDNLLPWIEVLVDWLWLGKHALELLVRQEQGTLRAHQVRALKRDMAESGLYTKRIDGWALLPLVQHIIERAEHHVLIHVEPVEPGLVSSSS